MIVLVLWLRVRSSRFTDRIDLPVLQSILVGTDGLAFKEDDGSELILRSCAWSGS